MTSSITYESVLSYLDVAQKEISSRLDVKRSVPFDQVDQLATINDIQIYCDVLSLQLTEELSELPSEAIGGGKSGDDVDRVNDDVTMASQPNGDIQEVAGAVLGDIVEVEEAVEADEAALLHKPSSPNEDVLEEEEEANENGDADSSNGRSSSTSNRSRTSEQLPSSVTSTGTGSSSGHSPSLSVTRSLSCGGSPLTSPNLVRSMTADSPSLSLSLSHPSVSSAGSRDDDKHLELSIEPTTTVTVVNSQLIQQRVVSYYDNNDEVNAELLTAHQLKIIMDKSELKYPSTFPPKTPPQTSPLLPRSKSMSKSVPSPPKNPLFGCQIDLIQQLNGGVVLPPFIEKSLIYLANKALRTVGIFRKSGVKSRIVLLRQLAEDGVDVDLDEFCVYDVADVAKTWFRELKPKQLITQELVDLFRSAKRRTDVNLVVLPDHHRQLLQVILRFLSFFASQCHFNQMNSHNLSICLTPSLCECDDGEQQLLAAQKCLEYCIDHCEALFVVCLSDYNLTTDQDEDDDRTFPIKHEASAIVEASPEDVLKRILYQRNLLDPTITEWHIEDDSADDSSDRLVAHQQTSAFLPVKQLSLTRRWRIIDLNNMELVETGRLHSSRWSMVWQGEGKTRVVHVVAADQRGHGYSWYTRTFPGIHNRQLDCLRRSFQVTDDGLPDASDV